MLSFSIANILKDTCTPVEKALPSEGAHYPVTIIKNERQQDQVKRSFGSDTGCYSEALPMSEASSPPVCSTPDPESSSTVRCQFDTRSESPVSATSPDTSYSYEENDSRGSAGPCRRKKSRTTFTGEQIRSLENSYRTQRYLPATERRGLAKRLRLSDQQVKTWFQNRRMKEKRQVKDNEDIYRHIPHIPDVHHPMAGYQMPPGHPAPPCVSAASFPMSSLPHHHHTASYPKVVPTSFPPVPTIQRHPMVSCMPSNPTMLPSANMPISSHVNWNMMSYKNSLVAPY